MTVTQQWKGEENKTQKKKSKRINKFSGAKQMTL
jgi:hypothetical protein